MLERSERVTVTHSAAETRAFGIRLASLLRPGDVVLLHGDLGAGKTTLTQGIAQGLGITEPVQSPTFTLVSEHDGRAIDGTPVRLYHVDLYRIGGEEDLEEVGFDDLLAPRDGISIIEWPERAGRWLPDRYVLVRIVASRESERQLTIRVVPDGGDLAERTTGLSALINPDQRTTAWGESRAPLSPHV